MNLNTDKQKFSLKGVYAFYSAIITLCIFALFVLNLNLYFKAALCTLALLCAFIMRSLKKATILSADSITDERVDVTENIETIEAESSSTVEKHGTIDTYLTLLIEADEELSKYPSINKSSPSYNNLLNHRIGMKLNAMSQRNNHADKD